MQIPWYCKFGRPAALRHLDACATATEAGPAGMQYRPLGHTGHQLSLLTLGGRTVSHLPQAAANELVAEMLEAGVNAVDVAPTYEDSEVLLGNALRGQREAIFLSCKTTCHGRAGAAEELRRSLRRLQTDHVDLYQLHSPHDLDELRLTLGPGGALEAFLEARDQGLIRFIGITGHCPRLLLQALRRFDFDTVQFPFNFISDFYNGFGRGVLREARQRERGVLAVKTIAARNLRRGEAHLRPNTHYYPFTGDEEISLALRYVLMQPEVTTVPTASDPELARKMLAVAQSYTPLTRAELLRAYEIYRRLPVWFH